MLLFIPLAWAPPGTAYINRSRSTNASDTGAGLCYYLVFFVCFSGEQKYQTKHTHASGGVQKERELPELYISFNSEISFTCFQHHHHHLSHYKNRFIMIIPECVGITTAHVFYIWYGSSIDVLIISLCVNTASSSVWCSRWWWCI
jgi:hypothetical protein